MIFISILENKYIHNHESTPPIKKFNLGLIFTGIFSVFLLLYSCRKDKAENTVQSQPAFMLEARSFFEDEVLSTMPSQPGPEGNKTPLWEQAKMVKVSLGDALVVPIKYEKPQGIKAEGEKTFRDLQKSSYLLIYKDKNKNMQAEWVRLAPMGEKKNDKFVGIILVHEWNGKAKHAFAFNQNGEIALMKETNVFFHKASMRNSVKCYNVYHSYVDVKVDGNGLYDLVVTGYTITNCIIIRDFNFPSFQAPEGNEYDFGYGGGGGGYNGLEGPYEYSDKMDCAGVPNGTAIYSEECQKCIGGTTGIEKCPTDSLKKIMKTKNDCLTDSQISILNKSFNEYLRPVQKDPDPMFKVSDTVKCMRNLLYKKIEASGKKIGFCINHTLIANAVYRPESEDVLFTTESTLGDDRVLGHELFHVYQDTHYPGGIKQYQTGKVPVGFPNIEFEQALFNDIVNRKRDAMNNGSGKIKEEYKDWLDTITRNNTTQPKQFSDLLGKYNYFLEQFHKYPPYNDGIIHTSLLPNALLTFFSTSNCR